MEGAPSEDTIISSPANCFVEEALKDYCTHRGKCRREVYLQDFDSEFESVPPCDI